MDIFGLTPLDSALSALGLNSAQMVTDFLMIQTRFALVAFAIGFLLSLWQSAKEGNLKHCFVFLFISLVIFFVFQGPVRQQSMVNSAQEVYGNSSIRAQKLKETYTQETRMPFMLAFIGQTADMAFLGIISVLDHLMEGDFNFLREPFGIHKASLQAHQELIIPSLDTQLSSDIDEFSYVHYLPALAMFHKKSTKERDRENLWMGDARVVNYYSEEGKNQWEAIQPQVLQVINSSQRPWGVLKDAYKALDSSDSQIDDQMIAAVLRPSLDNNSNAALWFWAELCLLTFPYIYGGANFALYVACPLILLIFMISRRMHVLMHYAEIFLWIKSWPIGAAIAFYISLMAAKVQASTSGNASWLWEQPYYVWVACGILCVMPAVTWIGIHRILFPLQRIN